MFRLNPIGSSLVIAALLGILIAASAGAQDPIQHDSEHYVLLHQYQEKWAAEDKEVDQKLAELTAQNGGNGPILSTS